MTFKNDNDPFKYWKPGVAATRPIGFPDPRETIIEDMNPAGSIAAGIDALVERVAQRTADIVIDRLQHVLSPEVLQQPPEPPEQTRAREVAELRAAADAQHQCVLEALEKQVTIGPIGACGAIGGTSVVVSFDEPSLQTQNGRCAYIYAAESCNPDGRRYVDAAPGEFGFEYRHGEPIDEYHRGGNERLTGIRTLDEVVMAIRFLTTHREPCECMRSAEPMVSCERIQKRLAESSKRWAMRDEEEDGRLREMFEKRQKRFEAGCWLQQSA